MKVVSLNIDDVCKYNWYTIDHPRETIFMTTEAMIHSIANSIMFIFVNSNNEK